MSARLNTILSRCSNAVSAAGLWSSGPHRSYFHLVVHGGERQSCQLLAFRSRRHQADSDQDQAADHEHENRIVQEIHVHKPAQKSVIEGVTTGGAIHQLKNKARRAHHEPGQQ